MVDEGRWIKYAHHGYRSIAAQPPGVPEICKKSLMSCSVVGGFELFIIGKNFAKDTRVVFQSGSGEGVWQEVVVPDKEYLQQVFIFF